MRESFTYQADLSGTKNGMGSKRRVGLNVAMHRLVNVIPSAVLQHLRGGRECHVVIALILLEQLGLNMLGNQQRAGLRKGLGLTPKLTLFPEQSRYTIALTINPGIHKARPSTKSVFFKSTTFLLAESNDKGLSMSFMGN